MAEKMPCVTRGLMNLYYFKLRSIEKDPHPVGRGSFFEKAILRPKQ